MARRRKKILLLLLALVVGLGAALWFGTRGGRAEVKVTFLCFTNLPMILPYCSFAPEPSTYTQAVGVLLVTNLGSVPLRPIASRLLSVQSNRLPAFLLTPDGNPMYVFSLPGIL